MTKNNDQKMSGLPINKMHQRQFYNFGMLPSFTFAQSDHTLPNPDVSMQASSPNSVFLYEQDKNDMQRQQSFEKGDDLNIDNAILDCAMENLDMDFILSEALRLEEADFLNYSHSIGSAQSQQFSGESLSHTDRGRNCPNLDQVKTEPIYQNDMFQMDPFNFESSAIKDENALDILRSEFAGNYLGSFKNTLTGSRDPLISEVQVQKCPNSMYAVQQGGQQIQSPVPQENSTQPMVWQSQQQMLSFPSAAAGTASEDVKIKTEPIDPDTTWDANAAFKDQSDKPSVSEGSSENERNFSSSRIERESVTSCTHDSLAGSRDDGFESDNLEIDTDADEDSVYLSDPGSLDSSSSLSGSKRREKSREAQYFWQYNAQSKGPKGARLYIPKSTEDPHVLLNFEDPVFDPGQKNNTIKHGGKARKGDGNDIAPNPKKLFQIGNELKKLNHIIDDLTPGNDVSMTIKNNSRREKNKLASRACRLKKKAQHEANKVKLYGLEKEHSALMKIIDMLHSEMRNSILSKEKKKINMTERYELITQTYHHPKVAHRSADFVNSILDKVAKGDSSGGLKK